MSAPRLPRERFDYSAIVDRPPLALPGGARIVVFTIVNVEEWNIESAMPRVVLSPPAGATAIPDVPNWSWHEYGMRVGFWRLKAALDRYGVRATMAVNASVCLSYPRIAEAALEAGWEFMGHGFKQRALAAESDQADVIGRAVETLRKFTGHAPQGWLGPGLVETFETPELLANAGIEYVCDWVADDQPFTLHTATRPLTVVPYSVELNDIPMMMIQHHRAAELFERTRDQFDRLYEEGAQSPRIMALAVHPYISGVPHRIKYFEQIYDYISSKPGVAFWKGEEILDWYRGQTAARL
jgi:peptidoglycan/xylan/chitin deacetylase (PgdA/CDA1 family)